MMKKANLLITGGAGFIGSNLVEHFMRHEKIAKIRVLDNLSTGTKQNIDKYKGDSRFEFIEGDIRDFNTCTKACEGMDMISHQAALGSVPRSIVDPVQSAEVNILGTVNIMHAANQAGAERIVLAFSSSTYGDEPSLPKREEVIGNPLSPYAVTKASIEQFARVFGETYGTQWVGLRYFNVFGPNQNPNNPYAAVIPLFCQAFIENKVPVIYGDGLTSRDFTYVDNVVLANELALMTESTSAINEIYNIACGQSITLIEIINILSSISGNEVCPTYFPERKGDVKYSLADISKAQLRLGYRPKVDFYTGLSMVYEWYRSRLK